MDHFDCYELCVQRPGPLVGFLRAVHVGDPRILREDFSGTAALSRQWIAGSVSTSRSMSARAVDLDPAALARAHASAQSQGLAIDSPVGLTLRLADAIAAPVTPDDACDIIFVGNFSIGYIQHRPILVEYLKRSRERLTLACSAGGIFVCDTYTGPSAFTIGSITRTHISPAGEVVKYTWQQRDADVLTGLVTCVLHFQVERDGDVIARFSDAFTYHWRLWSIPELRDAMHESGFARTSVYQDIAADPPLPLDHGQLMSNSGIVCIVARA